MSGDLQGVLIEKLDIRDDAIHYLIQQQDGSMQPMTARDTPYTRQFVAWVQVHDGFIPKPEWKRFAK